VVTKPVVVQVITRSSHCVLGSGTENKNRCPCVDAATVALSRQGHCRCFPVYHLPYPKIR